MPARTRAATTVRTPALRRFTAVPGHLVELAQIQCGVVTRAQLARHGVGPARLRSAVTAQRWQTVGRTVVVLHSGPLTLDQRTWVAVLLPTKACALAGASAATAAGLQGFQPERVHIVVRHHTCVGLPAWVKVHGSRRFSASDIVSASQPRTGTARSLVDAAAWSSSPRRACALLCAGVQQGLGTAARLATALRRAGAVRHAKVMREIVGDIGGGHTLAEIDLGSLALRAGLTSPRRQALRREPDGSVRYFDVEFDLPDGTALAVEVDGAMHLRPLQWWSDQDRQNEVVIGGVPVLRFASVTVRLDGGRVVDQLRRMRLAHERG